MVEGSASIGFDISSAGGTTAGIQNTNLDDLDITAYLTKGPPSSGFTSTLLRIQAPTG